MDWFIPGELVCKTSMREEGGREMSEERRVSYKGEESWKKSVSEDKKGDAGEIVINKLKFKVCA